MMRTIIITGGSSGIGRYLKEIYLEEGDVVHDLSRTNGFDITDKVRIKKYISENIKEVDIFIHCAGYNRPISVEKIKDTFVVWEKHHNINFVSFVYLTSLLHDKMKSKGVILALSSQSAELTRNKWSGYCTSKAALNSFIRNYSEENDKIRVIGFSPSKVFTPMIKKLYPDIKKCDCLDPKNVALKIVEIIDKDSLSGVIHVYTKESNQIF
jgi:NAD(P)-dependent dehydrogenase (short-subunit alcohol dehydrogenase family)